jgi:hypothetical protein
MRADPPSGPDPEPGADPEFGPGGYLPQRAADRARKIVLRERMALSWPVAAVVLGLVVLAAGAALLLRGGPPGEPFIPVVEFAELSHGEATVVAAAGHEVLVVRAPGALRAFAAPDQAVRWCAETDRLEGAEGALWRLDGRRVGGEAPSLAPLPVEVHDGVIHAAPTTPRTPPPPADGGEQPRCPPP